jgi:hypothetical protein
MYVVAAEYIPGTRAGVGIPLLAAGKTSLNHVDGREEVCSCDAFPTFPFLPPSLALPLLSLSDSWIGII